MLVFFFLVTIFCLYTKSALLADKASRGVVTGAAPRALALLLGDRVSPPGRWRGGGGSDSGPGRRSARLWGRLVSAAVSCWRRKHEGAWAGRCLGGRGSRPSSQRSGPRPRSATAHSWRTKYGRGDRQEK